MTKKFDLMKKMLNGSTTMPASTMMRGPNDSAGNVHYHDGVPCSHDHSHDHDHSDHSHHADGSCCDKGDDCEHDEHK